MVHKTSQFLLFHVFARNLPKYHAFCTYGCYFNSKAGAVECPEKKWQKWSIQVNLTTSLGSVSGC